MYSIKKTIQKEGRSDFWQCVDSWVYDHFSYPQEAFDNELDATVWVAFVIDKKGVMSVNKDSIDINVPYNKKEDLEKGKYKAIEEVSYRIFANFPKVTPAKDRNGKVIAVKGSYPISFEIPKDEDKKGNVSDVLLKFCYIRNQSNTKTTKVYFILEFIEKNIFHFYA